MWDYEGKPIKKPLLLQAETACRYGDNGARTHGLLNAIQALSQLSYIPV